MKNKIIKIFAVFLFCIFAGITGLYPYSDPDAAGGWNSSQREDDDFYSGNYHGFSNSSDPNGNHEVTGSADYEARAFSEAVSELAEMEENEGNYSSTDLEYARAKVEEAKERLATACVAEGKTVSYSKNGNWAKIKDETGKIVDTAGDPVKFSSGIYLHELEDICVNYGGCSFSVNRFFRSSNSKTNAELVKKAKPGLFGRGWKTNLESRVIRGYRHAFDFDEEAYEETKEIIDADWESIKKKAERYAGITLETLESDSDGGGSSGETSDVSDEVNDGEISGDEDQDDDEEDDDDGGSSSQIMKKNRYNQYLEIFKKARAIYCRVEEDGKDWQIKHEEGLKNRELDVYVRYGENSELAESLDEESVIYIDEEGFSYILSREDGIWKNETLENCGFTFEEDGEGFKVKKNDSGELFYGAYGQLVKTADEHGFVTEYEWDKENLVRIKVNGGTTIEVLCEEGRIKSFGTSSAQITYEYSADMLFKVSSLNGIFPFGEVCVSYEYDSNQNIEKVFKGDNSFTQIFYENPDKKDRTNEKIYVSSVKNENGDTEYFSYDLENKTAVYKDHDSNETVFGWDDKGRTIMESRPDGNVINYSYNDAGLLCEKEENGEKHEYIYDEENHLIKVLYSDSTADDYTWDGENIRSINLRNGAVLNFNYDYRNFCTDIFRDGERLFSYQYDAEGFLVKTTDCRGYEKNYQYDLNGNLIQCEKEKWRYDEKNRIIFYSSGSGITRDYEYGDCCITVRFSNGLKITQLVSKRGDVIEQTEEDCVTGVKRKRTFEYDNTHHIKKETLNGRTLKEYSWTPEGKQSGTIVYCAPEEELINQSCVKSCLIEYEKGLVKTVRSELSDRMNNLLDFDEVNFCVNKEGQRSTFTSFFNDGSSIEEGFYKGLRESCKINGQTVWALTFGGAELPCSIKDGLKEFSLSYSNGRLCSIKSALEDYNGVKFEYYPDSLLKKYTDKNGTEWYFEYNKKALLKKLSCSQGCVLYAYDDDGFPLRCEIFDKDGKLLQKSSYSYSQDRRTVTCLYGDYVKEIYTFDAFGNLIEKIDGTGNRTLFEYDDLNNLCTRTDANGNVTHFAYDRESRLIEIKNAAGQSTQFNYDLRGNCISARDKGGDLFRASYDCFGRITEYEARPFARKRFYEWDNFGRLLRIKTEGDSQSLVTNHFDDSNNLCQREYSDKSVYQIKKDSFGNVLYAKNRLGNEEFYEYDGAQNPVSTLDFNGRRTDHLWLEDTNVIRKNYEDGSFNEVTYDFAGRLVKAQNENSVLSFEYDTAGLLTGIADSFTGKKIQYKRNADALITGVFCDGRRIDYEWENSRLSSVKDVNENIKVEFKYSKTLREVERDFSTGGKIKTFHDDCGRMILKAGFDSDGKLCFVDGKVYDEKGFITFTLNSDFTVTRYFYDENGRIKKCLYVWNSYYEEYFKNLLSDAGLTVSKNFCEGEINRADDEEYLQLQKLCALIPGNFYQVFLTSRMLPVSFEYDKKGNMTEQKTPFGTIVYKYDAENRLLNWGKSGKCVWDNNGNLLEKHSVHKREVFKYNLQNRLVRAECSDLKNQTFTVLTYLYDALGRKIYSDSSDSYAQKYLYKGLGFEQLLSINAVSMFEESSFDDAKKIIRYGGIEENGTDLIRTAFEQDEKGEVFNNSSYSLLYDMTGKPMYLIDKNLSDIKKRRQVLFTDLNGTVIKTLDGENNLSDYKYDCFGNPVQGEEMLHLGFAGKHYETKAGFYEFGFRNYIAQWAGFMSEDPVKDGLNWYVYCNYDPVNFIDISGLTIIENDFMDMHDGKWCEEHINGTETTVGKAGCTVTAVAEAFTGLTGGKVTPKDIAESDSFSNAPGDKDLVDFDKLSNYGGGSYEVKRTVAAEKGRNAVIKAINDAVNSGSDYSVIASVEWNTKKPDISHYVCLTGNTVIYNAAAYYEITGTSSYDNAISGNPRQAADWIEVNGKTYVPAKKIKTVVTIRHSKDN